MRSILVFFPFSTNTGYAIDSYERAFFEMAGRLVQAESQVHFAFRNLNGGAPRTLPRDFSNLIEFDPKTQDSGQLKRIAHYLRSNQIDFAFGVDQPVHRPPFPIMRSAGVRTLVSYWGAPMGSVNSGVRLMLKRLQVRLHRSRPDHYIFESNAMAETATHGRGIPPSQVSVVHLGVDPDHFSPEVEYPSYLSDQFGIPPDRRVVYYSGHMEERKGVRVLIRAVQRLVEADGRDDVHLLVLGNRPGEEAPFLELLAGGKASGHVTFAGYRNDVPRILPSCYIGAIASTGWDSFTVSALEMAAAGLPLIVSNLQGLSETVAGGTTGEVFEPGNHKELASLLGKFLDNPRLRERYSRAARERILSGFTREIQVARLTSVCRQVSSAAAPQ